MSRPRTCHLPDIMALFCTGIDPLDPAEALQRYGADIVVFKMTELEGRQ